MKRQKIPFITYKSSENCPPCKYCREEILHRHIVILDKGICNYIQGKEAEKGSVAGNRSHVVGDSFQPTSKQDTPSPEHQPEIQYPIKRNPCCAWVRNYSDVSPCIELMVLYDDALKKNNKLYVYAVHLANRIIEDLGIRNLKATYGKWGARLETAKNKKISEMALERHAVQITSHPAWLSLKISTSVFTYGKRWEEHNKEMK